MMERSVVGVRTILRLVNEPLAVNEANPQPVAAQRKSSQVNVFE
jgi:hypothetical protein